MRILHTMLRVGDLDKSIKFYTELMGMKLLRRRDNEEYRYTLAFVGYQEERKGAVLELTHNWDTKEYDLGNGYGHIAIEVSDIFATCTNIENLKGKIT
ncbi:MAG: lactoylglutathione lyase, partial [Oleispira sp.]|nr:lactoylglutathione lyase [Oleispira sp.]